MHAQDSRRSGSGPSLAVVTSTRLGVLKEARSHTILRLGYRILWQATDVASLTPDLSGMMQKAHWPVAVL